ncbi:MAG TPA: glycosyltransferase, partial [Burkholderiaceae bacterium]|nr:glycosyltransferase [Burkholderiaceae bacterium]
LLRSGRLSIRCKINGNFQSLRLYRLFLWRAGDRLRRRVGRLPHDSALRRNLQMFAELPAFKPIWARIFKRGTAALGSSVSSAANCEALYWELFRKAQELPAADKIQPIARRVVLVNAGLAAGGAERQIVNTLLGLRNSGFCESVALLAEYIDHAPQLDFFLHELHDRGVEVAQVRRTVTLADDGVSSLPPSIAELAAELPGSILEEILNLAEEFRARRPSVVHAWQDATSIKAGIAAVIAGVPRIVLASRNVTPMNFTYYQEYMYPAYRALAALPSVTLLNNSEAGALDYANWLRLPRERFRVVRNGVDLNYLKRTGTDAVRAYRRQLGIPLDARVVGSVFRFWAEKRPMLWLNCAAVIAGNHPDVHFLVIGEGPMRREMETFVYNNRLVDRVHLPGACAEIATPLSTMDVFLLTSEFEGTPNVVLEAQWLGLPVVVTDAGGSREAIECNESGSLAVSSSLGEIASLVGEFLDGSETVSKARRAGPKFVADRFGVDRMILETLDVYGIGRSELVRPQMPVFPRQSPC